MATVDGYPVGIDREDATETPGAGAALHVMVGPASFGWPGLLAGIKGATGLPAWGTKERDAILRAARLVNGIWASAVMKATTKIASRGYTLTDSTDSQTRLGRAADILQSYGPGWVRGMKRGLQDYLQTNYGQVIAIERAANRPGARVTGLIHLDSLRCYPTRDPKYPVLYNAPSGRWHLLPEWGVIQLSDMTDPDTFAYGYGQCAADRAWETVLLDTAIQTYFREKVSGTRNLAIHILRGVSEAQLRAALAGSEEARENRGFLLYKGSTIVPLLSDVGVELVTIPLAEIPDGFDIDSARRDNYLRIANALGVPVQDIQPLSGQGLGTGTQSVVLDEAAEGQGLASYPKELAEAINAKVLPPSTTFAVTTNDVRDQRAQAEVRKIRGEDRAARIAAGEITVDEARQLALDDGDLPPELVAEDATPGGTLTSDEKPLEGADVLRAALGLKAQGKAPRRSLTDADVDALVAGALADREAWAWARQAQQGGDDEQ